MVGNFFAIGRPQWEAACKLGLNPAIAFLVLARGTGPDNVTTKWSAQAVESQGISWRRAQEAILALEKANLARNMTEPGKRKHPTRELVVPTDLDQVLWLPNSLVDGVGGTEPPIARLRRAQNADWLQAFVELYGMQDLVGDGGLPRKLVRMPFTRTHICDAGQFRVYGFDPEGDSYCDTVGPLARFKTKERPKEGWPSWKFLHALEHMGLLETVHHLAEGESHESELLHALTGDGEAEFLAAAIGNTIESLPGWIAHASERKGFRYVVPVLRDYPAPAVIGVYRLTHRPHTRLTAAWYAKHLEACQRFTRIYDAIARGDFREAVAA